MSSTGPKSGTVVMETGGGQAWASPSEILTDNGTPATCTFAAAGNSRLLTVTGCDFSEVDDDFLVAGLKLRCERSKSGGGVVTFLNSSCKLVAAGAAVGESYAGGADVFPASDTIVELGGLGQLFGNQWTAAALKDADSGLQLAIHAEAAAVGSIDFVDLEAFYIDPAERPDVEDAPHEFLMLEPFAEQFVYVPRSGGGDARLVWGIINRASSDAIIESGNLAPRTTIAVVNDATWGISSAELDTGGAQAMFSLRIGKPMTLRPITLMADHDQTKLAAEDVGMCYVEVR